jgi:hypothetical protein
MTQTATQTQTPTQTPTQTQTPTPTKLIPYYLITQRRTCDSGIENPVRFFGFFPSNHSNTPVVNNWYRSTDGICTYSLQITNTTPIYDLSGFTGTQLLTTNYGDSVSACGCNATPTPTSTQTPTPTTPLFAHSLGFAQGGISPNLGPNACSDFFSSPTTFWSNCSTLTNGCYIYATSTGGLVSQTGWYSTGSNYYYQSGPANPISNGAPCPTPTATPTNTPTQTPSNTPYSTPTATPPSVIAYVSVFNGSLDLPITDVTVNGVSVSYISGTNFPVIAGENGYFYTTEIGTYTIVASYGGHTSGQNITVTDSDSTSTCQDTNGGSGNITVDNSVITSNTDLYVTAADGACP